MISLLMMTLLAAPAPELTNQEAWNIYERYIGAWNTTSVATRNTSASAVIAENVQYVTPRHATGTRTTIIEDMAAFQAKFPGGHFEIGDVSANHDVALLTWVLVKADGSVVARGHDAIRVGPDGKIVSVATFAPSREKP